MKCDDVQRLLANGEASAAQSKPVEEHLAACEVCRQHRRGVEIVNASLQALRSNTASDGRLTRAAIAQFQAQQTTRGQSRFPRFWGWGLALGATAASVGLTFYQVWNAGKETGAGSDARSKASVRSATPFASPTPPASRMASIPATKMNRIDVNIPPKRPDVERIHEPQRDIPAPKYVVRAKALPQPQRKPDPLAAVPIPAAPVVDDLDYLNTGTAGFAKRWTTLTRTEEQRVIAEILRSVKREDDFVEVEPPLVAANRDAAVTRSALAQYRYQLQIVDARLQRKVTLGEKGTAFSELCKKLETLTGIPIVAGRNVMDDKITIFCKERPLRDIMREIATLFNFTWERSGEEGNFAYRLKQPLASALLEEELRNKDQNEALLALDKEMAAIRDLLNLSPEEAAQRAANTEGAEKQRLQAVAGMGRGPTQLYAQLSPDDLTALRDGTYLSFSSRPDEGGRSISPEIGAGILRSFPDARILPNGGLTSHAYGDDLKNGIPLTQHPGVSAEAALWVNRSELGRFELMGVAGFGARSENGGSGSITMSAPLAEGVSPSTRAPENAKANAPLRDRPEMRKKVSIATNPSCELNQYSYPEPPPLQMTAKFWSSNPKITSADALEAIHKATGEDVIGDYYTRVYDPDDAAAKEATLFDALCRIADNLRLRWSRGEGWLGFRSVSFFNDRQKEVPNRLLERWAAARKRNGYITIAEFIEMAKLSKVQLDSALLSEGVKAIYGLNEWDFLRGNYQRHLRFLASLPPAAQGAALSPEGLPFARLTYAEQQNFAQIMKTLPFDPEGIPGATFLVKTIAPPRKKPNATPAETEPTKDEEWMTLKFAYTWLKDGTLMANVTSYQSNTQGDAKSLPDLR